MAKGQSPSSGRAIHARGSGRAAAGCRRRRTGADGSVGITMDDDSLLSAGASSELVLDRYAFDATTNQGRFDASLNKGTLAVISGRIAKQAPGAMTVRTPNALLGARHRVRGQHQ